MQAGHDLVHAGSRGRSVAAILVLLAVAACAPMRSPPARGGIDEGLPVRIVMLGDVMLGRGVGEVVATDPSSVMEHLRPVATGADLALANLESPLTSRPHTVAGHALEADPAAAALVAAVGLDVVSLANNHASDAGPATIGDTTAAVTGQGLATVGAGADDSLAGAPVVRDVHGVRIGILAFDLSGGTAATAASPGVNRWDRARAEEAVTRLRREVDLLVVGLHGGVEYLPRPDPVLERTSDLLAQWGADVVWGQGAHVAYPVRTVTTATRVSVVAPGLGNAVFDQRLPGTDRGHVLEVLADRTGVLALRTGTVSMSAGRSTFTGWHAPMGDAVAIHGEWWTPARPVIDTSAAGCDGIDLEVALGRLPAGTERVAFSCGFVTDGDAPQVVVSYRRPFTPELLQDLHPGHDWTDAAGMSAHLAVMAADGRMLWGASMLLEPIGAVAACTGAVAVATTTLDRPELLGGGAWTWRDFGFTVSPTLDRVEHISCTDLDGDRATEPVVHRTPLEPRELP